MGFSSINPATGELLRSFDAHSEAEVEAKVALSHAVFLSHRKTSLSARAAKLRAAAGILETEKYRFARMMTEEMGKTLKSAVQEAEKCASGCLYYAENGERFLADEPIATNASRSFVRYQPLGPVLAIMPWNFPFWQVFRFAAPALMAGNTGLLKHASNVPQCALAIEEILLRAGFEEGCFQTLLVETTHVNALLQDKRIKAATLTGSEPAGQSVASIAGREIKKVVLELGGSDPFIVMPSANLNEAVDAAVRARTINNGQSCIAAKRFIVSSEVYSEFERKFVEQMKSLVVGDPMEEQTQVGPLATMKILNELHRQVQDAQVSGGSILCGGAKLERAGNFYEPTALANVSRQSPVFYEEFFGPVAMLFRARDAAEAIEIANDSPFGLGASVWTSDAQEQERFIEEIEAGQVFVNGLVASDPRLPFGGIKRSGFGRELGEWGVREFLNVKTVWCR